MRGAARFTPDSVAALTAVAVGAVAGTLGSDLRWLAALGGTIAHHGIPDGVPFAAAASKGWPNVPVGSELILHGLDAAGSRGFLLAQVLALAVAFGFLLVDLRAANAHRPAAAAVLLAIVVGTFPWLVVVRSELFSLALFPVLLCLLRAETRSPSRRVWLLVPLLALWSNLHGAVLVGLALACIYLVVERARGEPVLAGSVLVLSALAVCATPALWETADYYRGVLQNAAARSHFGLWARFSFTHPFDVLFLIVVVPLLLLVLRRRPRTWELIALAALVALTVQTVRGGLWLALFLVTPAALGLSRDRAPRPVSPALTYLAPVFVALIALGLGEGPHQGDASKPLLSQALQIARGTPILATPELAEQVALAGGKIWLGNPLDAFTLRDQRIYVDWLRGRASGDGALRRAGRVILVGKDSAARRRLDRLRAARRLAVDANAALYLRSG